MTWKIEVSARAFGIIAKFVSREETRYYLSGVSVEPAAEGVFLVATDGHRLGVYNDRTAKIEGVIEKPPIVRLPDYVIKEHFNEKAQYGARLTEGHDRQRVTIHGDGRVNVHDESAPAGTGVTFGGCLIDGEFPDWRRVLPAEVLAHCAAPVFNADYLRSFAITYNGCASSIRALGAKLEDPHIILTNDPDFFGVLMPMRPGTNHLEKFDAKAWLEKRAAVSA